MSGKAKTAQKGAGRKVERELTARERFVAAHERVMTVDVARGGRRRFVWRAK